MENALVRKSRPLRCAIGVPGDKSISHRALILASQGHGRSRIHGLSRGADVRNTARAVRALGARTGAWGTEPFPVRGTGLRGWREPEGVLDFGNSGTGIRLMAGMLAGHPFFSVLSGDRYLRRRPKKRVIEPLRLMGAKITGRGGGTLAPLAVQGTSLVGIEQRIPVASAQVKSALLLAGLLCKKIRNDRDAWQQMETFISEHSEAVFSHAYCPDCAAKALAEARDYSRRKGTG